MTKKPGRYRIDDPEGGGGHTLYDSLEQAKLAAQAAINDGYNEVVVWERVGTCRKVATPRWD